MLHLPDSGNSKYTGHYNQYQRSNSLSRGNLRLLRMFPITFHNSKTILNFQKQRCLIQICQIFFLRFLRLHFLFRIGGLDHFPCCLQLRLSKKIRTSQQPVQRTFLFLQLFPTLIRFHINLNQKLLRLFFLVKNQLSMPIQGFVGQDIQILKFMNPLILF